MTGTIEIADLCIQCIVGNLPHERLHEQTVFLDIELDLDIAEAARTDKLRYTVDYAGVCEVLTEFVQAEQFQLIEALAERSCEVVLERWPQVSRCSLRVRKPGALPAARYAAVRVERLNPDTIS